MSKIVLSSSYLVLAPGSCIILTLCYDLYEVET